MKYWLYFYKDKLYAYTDQVEYRDKFEMYRDMSKIKVIKENLDSNDLRELQLNHDLQLLVKYHFKMEENNYAELIVTKEEQLYTINSSVRLSTVGIFECCWDNPDIFNKEIRNALEVLRYTECYNIISDRNKRIIDDDIGVDKCSMEVDEFSVFMNMYADTFKDKF